LKNSFTNLKNIFYLTTIIAKESPNEMKRDRATEKQPGDHSSKIHEMSTMWKILNLTRATGQAQEVDSRLEEGEGEEDPRDSRITTPKTRTSIASIMEEGTTQKDARKPRKTWKEFSKRKR
jgi:hypothetical protein